MSAWLIAVCTLIYAGVAVTEALAGRWAMVIVYSGYAWANVGLIWWALQGN